MSVLTPMRKPSRMPFLTHAFTRQPVGLAGSGSAARMRPSLSEMMKAAKTPLSSGVYAAGLLSKSRSISVCMGNEESDRLENLFDLRLAGGGRRHHGQAPHGLEQAHESHCGLHGDRVRLDEVDV